MSKPVILCVDDEVVVLDSLKIELRKGFGNIYSYEVAESAEEAFGIIEELDQEQQVIIVIISDWLMPGMKGDDFLKIVHKNHPKTIKIMLTGQASDEAIEDARKQANLHSCIRKPWKAQELIDIIKSAIATH